MKNSLILFGLFSGMLFCGANFGETRDAKDSSDAITNNLSAAAQMATQSDSRQIEKLLAEITKQRQDQVDKLLVLLNDQSVFVRGSACYVLGLYRDDRACLPLAKYLKDRLPERLTKEPLLLSEYPASQALISIGSRKASNAVLNVLANSGDSQERNEAIRVLTSIEGKDIAIILIQRMIVQGGNQPGANARLKEAKAVLEGR